MPMFNLAHRMFLRVAQLRQTGPVAFLTIVLAGCAAPQPAAKPPPPLLPGPQAPKKPVAAPKGATTTDNIVEIAQFYASQPWIVDDEGRYVGLRVRAYFVSGETGKGAFVPGTITASLFALTTRPDGTYSREKVYDWTFDAQQAYPFEIPKPSPMGYSYGLILRWPPELNLMGREIQVVLSYQRQNGQLVVARGIQHTVPYPGAALPGAIEVTTTTRPVLPPGMLPPPAAEPPAAPPAPAAKKPPGAPAPPPAPVTQPIRGPR